MNRNLPKLENPMPPPPLTEEGKIWKAWHEKEVERIGRRESKNLLFPFVFWAFIFVCCISILYYFHCR